jgi:hypothetical protein
MIDRINKYSNRLDIINVTVIRFEISVPLLASTYQLMFLKELLGSDNFTSSDIFFQYWFAFVCL